MGLISDILNAVRGAGEADTVEGCEAALRRVVDERNAANAAIAGRSSRRRALLLDDASDKQVAALDREIEGNHLTLERLEIVEEDLFSRLQALRSEARQQAWRLLTKEYTDASVKLAKALRAALAAQQEAAQVIDAARVSGFEHEATGTFPPPPSHLNPQAVQQYEDALDRMADVLAGRQKPPAEIKRSVPRPAQLASNPAAGRVSLADREERPVRSVRAPRVDVAKSGQRLVRVLRNGLEAPDGGQCAVNDVIAMETEQAAAVVKNGAGEFVEPLNHSET
ncbi:hypothetical protein [Bradyrhizobium japonicum]|uniref:hypothetical protein n=1 Tax=Bradyrhizobium japonicum TaxID=375 RepID=UPI00200BAC42|nr:hypothetical protein [Bradyrhizobium japonicum]UQD96140.1 hypothetical protein JEY30_31870 [Bradyrhizobium japonicum]